jgi:hypothetical protein
MSAHSSRILLIFSTCHLQALEVFSRMSAQNEGSRPDLLISGASWQHPDRNIDDVNADTISAASADTVVIHPPQSATSIAEGVESKILEKPRDKEEQVSTAPMYRLAIDPKSTRCEILPRLMARRAM